MNCFVKVDNKLYADTLMGTVLNGTVEPKGIAKVIKVNKQFGLIIDSCEVIIVKVQYPWDILPKKYLKGYDSSSLHKTVVLTIAGCKFTIDKSLFLVSGNGEKQLADYLEINKKI